MRLNLPRTVKEIHIPLAVSVPTALLLASSRSLLSRHAHISLLLPTITWTTLWVASVLFSGLGIRGGVTRRRILCWAAGGLLSLATLCEAPLRDVEAVRWGKAILPLVLFFIARTRPNDTPTSFHLSDLTLASRQPIAPNSKRYLYIFTVSSFIILKYQSMNLPYFAMGISATCLTASALSMVEDAFIMARKETEYNNSTMTVSANGSVFRKDSEPRLTVLKIVVCLRDVSMVAAGCCLVVSLIFDSRRSFDIMIQTYGKNQFLTDLFKALLNNCTKNAFMILAVYSVGSFRTGCLETASALIATVWPELTYFRGWFLLIAALGCIYCLGESQLLFTFGGSRNRFRDKHLLVLVATFSFCLVALANIKDSGYHPPHDAVVPTMRMRPPSQLYEPKQPLANADHPIKQLIQDAETKFDAFKRRQSQSLPEAVAEYRRRYRIPPPPNFDKWYEFAIDNNATVIDEYDTIYNSLIPFWALTPYIIRSRIREAIGYVGNRFMSFSIRNGNITLIDEGDDWQQQATLGMMKKFIEYLPDMDIAFNLHDEPRIVVPNEILSQMVAIAHNDAIPAAAATKSHHNAYSSRPSDMNDGRRIVEYKLSRFNVYAHQQTWLPSVLSCNPDSPARDFRDVVNDNLTSWALGELGFVYNETAMSDICMTPSLRGSFGFFERPNAYNVAHDLIPVFSQSKLSSYQDILYPSPWYWAGRVHYNEKTDIPWAEKNNTLWWRGSTTGGYSRGGGWRRQHRQRLVGMVNALNSTKILVQSGKGQEWRPKSVKRADYRDLVDVKFTFVGQCDEGDCDAQNEYFEVVSRSEIEENWRFKHLLDMDGNAFSGRFHAFLKSQSLPYKMALFREWHMEWLKPWIHYIPLSLRAGEWLETVRYLNVEPDGRTQAAKMAAQGRKWAHEVLRQEDFEVWFFRLLLEYGRLIDDNRDKIGYT